MAMITACSAWVGDWMRLRRVDLTGRGLEHLPRCALRVDGIHHLSLAGNRLQAFPRSPRHAVTERVVSGQKSDGAASRSVR